MPLIGGSPRGFRCLELCILGIQDQHQRVRTASRYRDGKTWMPLDLTLQRDYLYDLLGVQLVSFIFPDGFLFILYDPHLLLSTPPSWQLSMYKSSKYFYECPLLFASWGSKPPIHIDGLDKQPNKKIYFLIQVSLIKPDRRWWLFKWTCIKLEHNWTVDM